MAKVELRRNLHLSTSAVPTVASATTSRVPQSAAAPTVALAVGNIRARNTLECAGVTATGGDLCHHLVTLSDHVGNVDVIPLEGGVHTAHDVFHVLGSLWCHELIFTWSQWEYCPYSRSDSTDSKFEHKQIVRPCMGRHKFL